MVGSRSKISDIGWLVHAYFDSLNVNTAMLSGVGVMGTYSAVVASCVDTTAAAAAAASSLRMSSDSAAIVC